MECDGEHVFVKVDDLRDFGGMVRVSTCYCGYEEKVTTPYEGDGR